MKANHAGTVEWCYNCIKNAELVSLGLESVQGGRTIDPPWLCQSLLEVKVETKTHENYVLAQRFRRSRDLSFIQTVTRSILNRFNCNKL